MFVAEAEFDVPPNQAGLLSEYAAGTSYERLPHEVVERAKLIVFDQLACTLLGSELPAGRVMARFVEGLGGSADAAAFGVSRKCPAPFAALVNGTAGTADEFDSVHVTSRFDSTGHAAAVLVSAVVAVAERQSCTGRALLNALVLGFDTGARVISATGGVARMKSEHGLYAGSLHSVGAAFACARLLGLDEQRHRYAAALAVNGGVSLTAFYAEHRHMSKALVQGQSASAGVSAALMAAAGFEASEDILGGQGGIAETWGAPDREGELLAGLGTDFAVMGTNFKFYSGGYPIHAAIEAVLTLRARHVLRPEQIARITVVMPSVTADVVSDRTMPSIDLRTMVAVAVVAGNLGWDEAHSVALHNDPAVLRLRALIEVRSDPGFDRTQPRGSTVSIELAAEVLECRVDHPRGHSLRAPASSAQDLKSKWEELLTARIGASRFDDFYQACSQLESVDDIDDVVQLVAGGCS